MPLRRRSLVHLGTAQCERAPPQRGVRMHCRVGCRRGSWRRLLLARSLRQVLRPQPKENTMSLRTTLFCTALSLSAAAVPMLASARVYLDVDVAPPPPPEEVVPAPRVGFTWAPGYY